MRGVHLYTLQDFKNHTPYERVYNAFGSKPSSQVSGYYQTMMEALDAAGSLAKCDIFQFFSAHNQADSLINWKNPGLYNPTAVDSPTWTQYEGFTSTLSPKGYVNCNYNPASHGVKYKLNDATVIVGTDGGQIGSGNGEFGGDTSPAEVTINGYNSADTVRASINSRYSDIVTFSDVSGIGHFGATRTNTTQLKVWQNKSNDIATEDSTSIPNRILWATTRNLGGYVEFTGKQVRYVWVGGALTDQEYEDTIDAIEACLDSLGTGLINLNVIINGGFDTDTDWTKQAGWTITGGKAVATGTTSHIYTTVTPLILGETYKITFTVNDYSSGRVYVRCGSGTNGTLRTADGTYTETLVCSGNEFLLFGTGLSSTLKIDDVIAIKQ